MSTATKPGAETPTEPNDNVIHLLGVGWGGFQTMLDLRGDRRSPRVLYLDGNLTLVSPSLPHEYRSRRLGLFVAEVALGLGIPYSGVGSTTIGREPLDSGVEGDQEFYFANVDRIRGKEELDLNVDPPPDLAIEVVITHGVKQAMEIYRRLGVPELWVCTRKRLRFFRLGDDGNYAETPSSIALPSLSADEVFGWVDQPPDAIESEWLRRVRDWVRDELAPRARAGGQPDGE